MYRKFGASIALVFLSAIMLLLLTSCGNVRGQTSIRRDYNDDCYIGTLPYVYDRMEVYIREL